MKILCVEDGSVNVEELENGIKDGGILVYRQGAEKPFVLDIPATDGIYKQMWLALCEKIKYSPYEINDGRREQIRKIVSDIEKEYIGTVPKIFNGMLQGEIV